MHERFRSRHRIGGRHARTEFGKEVITILNCVRLIVITMFCQLCLSSASAFASFHQHSVVPLQSLFFGTLSYPERVHSARSHIAKHSVSNIRIVVARPGRSSFPSVLFSDWAFE